MMDEIHGEDQTGIAKADAASVDQSIARLANRKMGDVVSIAEGQRITIGHARSENASDFFVARLFTDAVFSQDIRSIQLIINRIDGGLPKDVDVDKYQTEFGDCLSRIMRMTDERQLKVEPDDTVMMAMCKSLYSIAVQDIYWDHDRKRPRRPSDSVKKERDAAMRMVLERTGGRKTLSSIPQSKENVELADWIACLPEPRSDLV